jgi:diguanylate cyclase (GGDEF)-like protein
MGSAFNNTPGIRLVAIAALLTVAAVAGREVLPKRTLDLLAPESGLGHVLTVDEAVTGAGKVTWMDEKEFRFQCHYPEAGVYQTCGLTFLLTRTDKTQGIDLRRFKTITLDIAYRGNSPVVRLGIRNFVPGYSLVHDENSSRLQATILRAADLATPMVLDLAEFTSPAWWIEQNDVPREHSKPKLDNATTLTIDLPLKHAGPAHQMQVRRLELQGDWIGRESLYLGLLAAWMLGVVGAKARRWAKLRRHHRSEGQTDGLAAGSALRAASAEELPRRDQLDELTGALNRRGVEQAIADLGQDSARTALIVVNIDRFSAINASHGPDAGEDVLRRVAAILARNVRGADVLGRLAGEEFVIACMNCSAEQAAAVAEKIRRRIEASAFGPRQRISVTASFGVAAMSETVDFAEALRRAGDALHQARAQGKNRVAVADVSAATGL